MGFFVGCKSGERRRGCWEEGGYLWLGNPFRACSLLCDSIRPE
jgi:hypothetical protein